MDTLQERYERACWEYQRAKEHMQDLARQLANQYASEEATNPPESSIDMG